ncbi:MAG: TIGR04282 family arsenosugar biosynthesis glycosyltransferase [Planctomycetes bacterium]|nr:TIGR04282 family arsenosugar biosynthesis glycosyltransferase [Planctomycetota bacterium]
MTDINVLIFAKYPEPGAVKTRMVPPLTFEQAATLHRLSLQTVCEIVIDTAGLDATLVVTPDDTVAAFGAVVGRSDVACLPQGDGDLGSRLRRAVSRVFDDGGRGVVLLGADSPTLPVSYLQEAIIMLGGHDVVMGPCDDGGYYLLGLGGPHTTLFDQVDWGGSLVASQTRARSAAAGLDLAELPAWYDLDRFDNLARAADDLRAPAGTDPAARRELRTLIESLTGD